LNFPNKHQIQRVLFWTAVTVLFAAPLEILHLLLEFLHLLFEWTEVSLDFIIEVVFDTSLHNTQIVVFYIIIGTILSGLYWLWKCFPAFYARQKANLLDFFSEERESIVLYWQESIINKILLISAAIGLIFLLFI
jgi:hypothetical protein